MPKKAEKAAPAKGLGARKLIAIAAVVVVALIVGITVWATSRGDSSPARTFADYRTLFQAAIPHQTTISVLDQWPKPPYQTYKSGKDQCFEWYETQTALYNLCFKNGVLDTKDLE